MCACLSACKRVPAHLVCVLCEVTTLGHVHVCMPTCGLVCIRIVWICFLPQIFAWAEHPFRQHSMHTIKGTTQTLAHHSETNSVSGMQEREGPTNY
jgi:hypothetical protein